MEREKEMYNQTDFQHFCPFFPPPYLWKITSAWASETIPVLMESLRISVNMVASLIHELYQGSYN